MVESTSDASALSDGRGWPPERATLPEFATPEWLRENHHLMRADLRKLAMWLADEYVDWPAEADGTDDVVFWRTVHLFAQRWTWFLWLFEKQIVKIFGRVKGSRKQLGTRVRKRVGDRARSLQPSVADSGELSLLEDLETLWEAREHELVAQCVWVLSCLMEPVGRTLMMRWLGKEEINDLIGAAVRQVRVDLNPERDDLRERLVHTPAGPELEALAVRAVPMCEVAQKEMDEAWSLARRFVAAHGDYREVEDELSCQLYDLDCLLESLNGLENAKDEAIARCRHAMLRAMLQEALEAVPQTRFADVADALGDQVAGLLTDAALPLAIPDPEWERCRELAERFRAEVVEPGERERALQAASLRYAETPSAANLETLQAAAEAVKAQAPSNEPAGTLFLIEACLHDLVVRFGAVAELREYHEMLSAPETRERKRTASDQIAELKAAVEEAEEKAATLLQTVEDTREENSLLRREKHRLQQRLAILEGTPPVPGQDDEAVLPPETYAELPDWTERHFAGKVALSGRAHRALKGAEFEDVELVGRAIGLLGGSYWLMKTEGGRERREAFDDELRALRLLETPSLSRDRQGKARDDFSVEWNGRRLTLDRHLKTSSRTRDPKYCFRLYFAWDEADRQVVIGHLPGHMKT